MRLSHSDGTVVHVAYCTNVHPGETLTGVVRQLETHAVPVRRRLSVDRLGVGLWLAHEAVSRLTKDKPALTGLRGALDDRGLEVVTLNGFPYRGFHDSVVKRRVYLPDWSDPERLRYTLDLARVLAALLPSDVARGSISTLPLGWHTPWLPDQQEAARRNLDELAGGLAEIEADTGRQVRVGFEPEPGCVVETTADAATHLSGLNTERLGICLDACHLAVAAEEPREAYRRLAAVGLDVVKLQASCALVAPQPRSPAALIALEAFAGDRFLHQVREPSELQLYACDDLCEALCDPHALPGHREWRVHFHVPLQVDPAPPLRSTRSELEETLRTLFGGPTCGTDHVEVETYTWEVLPPEQRPRSDDGLVAGIADEIAWTYRQLLALGLDRIP